MAKGKIEEQLKSQQIQERQIGKTERQVDIRKRTIPEIEREKQRILNLETELKRIQFLKGRARTNYERQVLSAQESFLKQAIKKEKDPKINVNVFKTISQGKEIYIEGIKKAEAEKGERSKSYAQYLVERKLAGKKIVMDEDILRNKGYDPRIVKSTYRQLISVPATKRELSRVAGEKIQEKALKEEAQRYGFKDVREYQYRQSEVTKPEKITMKDIPAERLDTQFINKVASSSPTFQEERQKALQKEIDEYETLTKDWEKNEEGLLIAPSEESYKKAQKEFQDIKDVEEEYKVTPFGTPYYFLPTEPHMKEFTYGIPGHEMTFDRPGIWMSPEKQEKIREWQIAKVEKIEQRIEEIIPTKVKEFKFTIPDLYKGEERKLTYGIPGSENQIQLTIKGKEYEVEPGQFLMGATKEFYTYPIKYPAKTITLVGVGAAASPVLGAVKGVSTSILGVEGTQTIGSIAGISATSFYLGRKLNKWELDSTWEEKGRIFGETAVEITALGLGSYGYQYIKGFLKTIGRTEIPKERLVPKDVLSGKKSFPKAPAKEHLKFFETKSSRIPGYNEPFMYHATGQKFWDKTFVAGKGTSYDPGLFGSYGVSPHFLRVGSPYNFFSFDFFNVAGGDPGILAIKPIKFSLGRYTWKDFLSGKFFQEGVANIPAVKPEVESILPPGTTGTIISSKYYTTWGGIRIPLDIAETTGVTTTSLNSNLLNIDYGSSSLVTSGSFLISSLISESTYESSYTPSKVTYTSPISPSSITISQSSSITSPSYSSTISKSNYSYIPKSFVPSYPSTPSTISTPKFKPLITPPPQSKPSKRMFKKPSKRMFKIPKRKSIIKVSREPSLAALGLKIKSPKRFIGEETGLTIRPIISKKRKVKKKKKKKGWWFL